MKNALKSINENKMMLCNVKTRITNFYFCGKDGGNFRMNLQIEEKCEFLYSGQKISLYIFSNSTFVAIAR